MKNVINVIRTFNDTDMKIGPQSKLEKRNGRSSKKKLSCQRFMTPS